MIPLSLKHPAFLTDTKIIGVHFGFLRPMLVLFDLETRRCEITPFLEIMVGDNPVVHASGKLLFTGATLENPPTDEGVHLANTDGTNRRTLYWSDEVNDDHLDDPVFSPDGNVILFTILNGRRAGIYRAQEDTETPRRLRRAAHAPDFSPDGRWIACNMNEWKDRSGEFIIILPATGGTARFVCDGYAPKWSPDGRRLCFTDRSWFDTRRALIGIVDGNGSNREILTPERSEAFDPQWSQDGESLWFPMNGGIRCLGVDTGKMEIIVPWDGCDLWFHAKSPDERWVIYFDEDGGVSGTVESRFYALDRLTGQSLDLFELPVDDAEVRRAKTRIEELLASPVHTAPHVRRYLKEMRDRIGGQDC